MAHYAVDPIPAIIIISGLLSGAPASPLNSPRATGEQATRGAAVTSSPFLISVGSVEQDIGSRDTVTIDDEAFAVEVADEPNERQRGLSGRGSLARNRGMLFVYETPRYPGFWMKGMRFPIDIIYINDNRIVTIVANVPPPKTPTENLPVYRPKKPADKVLEISGGLAGEYGFQEGDTVRFSLV